MKPALWVGIALAVGSAGSAIAQPAPPDGAAGSGSGSGTGTGTGSGSGSAEETVLPPEHIGGDQPAPPATPPPTTTPAPPGTPAPAGTPAPSEPQSNAPLVLDALKLGSNDRIELFMFGDTSMIAHTGEKLFFNIGELGLQITAHLAKGLVGRMESALSYNADYGTDIDMERMYLEYRADNFIVTAGRTHAELGYWNNAFHHGRWLQLTIARPRVLRFEDDGGMLPVHHVGVTVEHTPDRGATGLDVALSVGNGHGPSLLGIQTNSETNYMKSILLRVGGVGFAHDTLRFGVNGMLDKIEGDPTVYPLLPNTNMWELITGAYLALRGQQVIVFSEVYNVLHSGGGKSWDTTDGFVVAGYRIEDVNLIPYAELEARHGDGGSDPFYNPDPAQYPEATGAFNYVEGIGGLHYDLNPWSALKLELGVRRIGGGALGNQGVELPLMNTTNDYRAEINWSFGR